MTKNIIILISLLSYQNIALSDDSIDFLSQDEKEIIILSANQNEKKILKDFLSSPKTSGQDLARVKAILKRILAGSERGQPMMTMQTNEE